MAITLVNSTSGTGFGAGGGATAAMDTTGAKLLVCAIGHTVDAGSSFTDNQSNTWTLLSTETVGAVVLSWYYVLAPTTNAAHTFSFTGSSVYPSIAAAAYTATDSIIFDQKSNASATATSVAPGSLTPIFNTSLVVSAEAHDIGESQSVTESLTIRENEIWVFGVQIGAALGDIVQGAAAAINPSWSSASSTSRAAGQAVFYETPDKLPVVMGGDWIQQIQSPDVLEGV